MVNRGFPAHGTIATALAHAVEVSREQVAMAEAVARIGVGSGIGARLRPRGVFELLRARWGGSLGLPSLFRIHAANQPEAVAIIHEGRSWSYRELDARVERLASRLRHEHGLGRGDAAVLMMHNRPEFLEAQAAMARLGGAAVSAGARSSADELDHLITHSGAKAIFVEAELLPMVQAGRHRWPNLRGENVVCVAGTEHNTTSYEQLVREGWTARLPDGSAAEASVVVYTSGTTGRPKGAVRRFPPGAQRNFLQAVAELKLRADDRHLVVCPLYHTTAFGFVGFTFLLGGTVVLESQFTPQRVLAAIEMHRITTSAMVPTMLYRLVGMPREERTRFDTRTLRAVFSAGAPLSGTLAQEFIGAFGPVLFNVYGSTETGINTVATPAELLRAPGTIGHAVRGNELAILDERGEDVGEGATGELFVRNAMLVDYHRDEAATRASMRDGFFSVGDLAHRDAHGLFFIDGRKRDMLISGGVNVYPAEIEEVLARHPAVAEAAVVGVPDPEWGERVRAFVALREGMSASAEDLTSFCREHLSGPKVPREFRVLPELPRNPTGKVLKRDLRALG